MFKIQGKTRMAEKPSHIKQLSLIHVCKIGLKQNKSFLFPLSFFLFYIFSFCFLKFFRFNFSSYLKCFRIVLRPYEKRILLGLFERTCLFDTNIQFTSQRFPWSFFLFFLLVLESVSPLRQV